MPKAHFLTECVSSGAFFFCGMFHCTFDLAGDCRSTLQFNIIDLAIISSSVELVEIISNNCSASLSFSSSVFPSIHSVISACVCNDTPFSVNILDIAQRILLRGFSFFNIKYSLLYCFKFCLRVCQNNVSFLL